MIWDGEKGLSCAVSMWSSGRFLRYVSMLQPKVVPHCLFIVHTEAVLPIGWDSYCPGSWSYVDLCAPKICSICGLGGHDGRLLQPVCPTHIWIISKSYQTGNIVQSIWIPLKHGSQYFTDFRRGCLQQWLRLQEETFQVLENIFNMRLTLWLCCCTQKWLDHYLTRSYHVACIQIRLD